jgi:Na+-translocating ferredoxin:NAD+ oxidoreductase RnfG subunit
VKRSATAILAALAVCAAASQVLAVTVVGKKEFIARSLPTADKMTKVTVALNAENKKILSEKWKVAAADSTVQFIVSRTAAGARSGGVLFTTVYATEHRCVHGLGVSLDSAGAVKEVVITEMYCERAMPMATQSFLGQFPRKSKGKTVELNKEISGVTGATESCREVTAAVNLAVAAFIEFVK